MLDTNICIAFLLRPTPPLIDRFDRHFGQLQLSAISAAELRVGNRTSEDPQGDADRVEMFISQVALKNFNDEAAIHYGRIVRQVGVKRTSFDRLIAAHALSLGLTLVTANVADFADVPGLAVEDWTQ